MGGGRARQVGTSAPALGVLGGALIGSQFGHGQGRVAGTIIGAVAGGAIGRTIGKNMDRDDVNYYQQTRARTLETAAPGQSLPWSNPSNGHSGTIVAQAPYSRPAGNIAANTPRPSMSAARRSVLTAPPAAQPDGQLADRFGTVVREMTEGDDEKKAPAGTLMAGKRGLIMGVANDKSIAWGISQYPCRAGGRARLYLPGRGAGAAACGRSPNPSAPGWSCPATSPTWQASIPSFATLAKEWGQHRLRRPRHRLLRQGAVEGPVCRQPRSTISVMTMNISVYSFHRRRPARREADEGPAARC
ncbi:MAG: glycine zipper domain-containing protein [Alphaproteobacteria bacterium]